MSEGSDRASHNAQQPANGGAKRIAIVLLLMTAVGALLGVTLYGLVEWLPALVLPHGGVEHIHWKPLAGTFALVGGASGLALGLFIIVARRVIRSGS